MKSSRNLIFRHHQLRLYLFVGANKTRGTGETPWKYRAVQAAAPLWTPPDLKKHIAKPNRPRARSSKFAAPPFTNKKNINWLNQKNS